MIQVRLDRSVDAASIVLRPIEFGGVKHTYPIPPDELGGAMINLKFDGEWRLISIEVIHASLHLPQSLLDSADKIDGKG